MVFCRPDGRPYWREAVRLGFRKVCQRAGVGEDWHPHELRHSFVSVLSDAGVSIEDISDAAGHSSSTVTREVYRHPDRRQGDQGGRGDGPDFRHRERVVSDDIRVVVLPDPDGRLFDDDVDPGDVVFDEQGTPILQYGRHAGHGIGWTLLDRRR